MMFRPWGTYVTPFASICAGAKLVTFSPFSKTSPDQTFSNPKTALNTVDFPAPLGPMIVVIVPGSTLNETPFKTVMLPYPPNRFFTSINSYAPK